MVTAFNGCEFVLSCLCLVWPGAKVSLLWPHPRSCLRGFPFNFVFYTVKCFMSTDI